MVVHSITTTTSTLDTCRQAPKLGTDLSNCPIRVTLDRTLGGSLSSSALAGTGSDSTRTDSIHLTSLSLFTDGYGHYGSSSSIKGA